MGKWQVIIIDDERLAREELRRALVAYPELEVVAEAEHADEAEEQIRKWQPQLIFLDIQMPERTGFDLLESLEQVPEIIFTTAFDQYAVKAFEANALDYLVKPIRDERLSMAMEKVRIKLSAREQELPEDKTLFIKDGERYHFIKVSDIYLAESAGNYARLYFSNKKIYIRRSLNQLENILPSAVFFRTSRTEIINLNFISSVESLPNGHLMATLQSGQSLVMSNRQSAVFRNKNSL